MSSKTRHVKRVAWLLVPILTGFCAAAEAQSETVLYTFGNTPTDGYEPGAPLLMDGSGNLFGTTSAGGTAVLCPDPSGLNACGTVFELVNSSGTYTEKVLYNFNGAPSDGDEPTAGLIMDSSGNLYGTTGYGGPGLCGGTSCGTVFELVKSSNGYTEKVLHSFNGFDGAFPLLGLIMDSSDNLYGTAQGGGANGYGTVFELVNSSGSYSEKVLYNFGASTADGASPVGGLVMDGAGNLFGTTSEDGGPFNCGLTSCGTVFELVNSPNGYTEKVLYTFAEIDGANPVAGLIMDTSGNLYGTTRNGGAYGFGTVFELINSSGNYTEEVLHSFGGMPSDGVAPLSSLLRDGSGNLFGTTSMGGSATSCGGYGCGTVFELLYSSGTYTEKVLHSFGGVGDGESPGAALIMDSSGNLYSTTTEGGSSLQLGTVFEINPSASAPAVTLSSSSLTFNSQILNMTSPPQSLTITNSGISNLIFGSSGVTLSGPNVADFAISANACSGVTVAPKASCSVSVTFTPTVAANETAVLTFSDNAVYSAQTVALIGTGITVSPSVTFSLTSLTFSSQTVSTTSAAQAVTLTNVGGSSLSITNISTTSYFNQTNNCGSSVAAGESCVIQVRFAPTTGGQLIGSVSVADNAPGSPQIVTFAGIGADFTVGLASGSPPSVVISPGTTASYSLTVTPQGEFNQTVMFTCGGAPSMAACSVSPATVILDGTNAAPLTVSVTTTAPSLIVPHAPDFPIASPAALLVTLSFELFGLLLLQLAASRRMACEGRVGSAAIVLLTAAVWICSCGGGGSSSGSTRGTPAGTYTLTVTGTSGTLLNSTSLTLTVK